MKKFIVLLITGLMFSIVSVAQTTPTAVTPDAYITGADYEYIWGTTADTLTDADTLEFVYRIKGTITQDFWIKLYNDFVSGSAGGKLKTYKSMDGVNYEVTAAADSLTVTALEADAMNAGSISLSDFNAPYLKFIYIQSGTAVTVPKLYIYTKFN